MQNVNGLYGVILLTAGVFLLFGVFPAGAQEAPPLVEKDESGYYYTVQKGDTLWDLSQRFLNSPYLWPDLWEANSDVPIKNPHLIYPGQKIRLFKKYPERVVVEEDMSFQRPEEEDTASKSIFIPPTGAAVPPRLSPIEGSGAPDDSVIEYNQINRVGFIRYPPVKPHGQIFETVGEKSIISPGDEVYIKHIGRVELILGKQYKIYRTFELIKDNETGEDYGSQHYFTGVLEIIRREPEFVIGRVTKSFRSIYQDDFIMPYEPQSPRIEKTKSREGLIGKIIGTEEENSNLLGQHSVAFIDKGSEHGVGPGQIYEIFIQKKAVINPVANREITLTPEIFGKLMVLRSESKTSTALITHSTQVIYPGSYFKSP